MAMKHRDAGPGLNPLVDALLAMRTPKEMKTFLDDLCTPSEL